MLFGVPTSPTAWALMILAFRLIRLDGLELDKHLHGKTHPQRTQPRNTAIATPIINIIFDFLSLFLAFNSIIGGIAAIMLGLLLLDPLFGAPEKNTKNKTAMTKPVRERTRLSLPTYLSRNEAAGRPRKHKRRWSDELKSFLRREDNAKGTEQDCSVPRRTSDTPRGIRSSRSGPTGVHLSSLNTDLDTAIAMSPEGEFDSSPDTLVNFDIPSRPPSRLSKHTPLLPPLPADPTKLHDYLNCKSPSPSLSPMSLPADLLPKFDLDIGPALDLDVDHDLDFEREPHFPMLELLELQVNDWVQLVDDRQGIIRSLGSRISSATEWIGIELIVDIAVNGAIAADWPGDVSTFVRPSAVERILHRPQADARARGDGDDEDGSEEYDDGTNWGWRYSVQSVHTLRTLASIRELPGEESDECSEEGEDEQKEAERKAKDDSTANGHFRPQRPRPTPLPWSKPPRIPLAPSATHSHAHAHPPLRPALYSPFSDTDSADSSDLDSDAESYTDTLDLLNHGCTPMETMDDSFDLSFSSEHYSRPASFEADDDRAGMCLGGDTADFEARMENLVNGLDDILTATRHDLDKGQGKGAAAAKSRRGRSMRRGLGPLRAEQGAAEAPVVKPAERHVWTETGEDGDGSGDGTAGVRFPGKLKRTWSVWIKGAKSAGVGEQDPMPVRGPIARRRSVF